MSTKIASFFAELTANTSGLDAGLTRAKAGLTGLASSSGLTAREIKKDLGIITAVVGAVGVAFNATAGSFVRYSNEVRTMTQLTGESANEMSRLIQIADDYKVTTETLTMAQRELSKDGMSLSIDTLGNLSDAYLRLGSGAEQTRFLLENFGRSGLQMAEMMEQGSDRIQAAAAGIAGGLVLDEADLESAREFERQLDALQDAWLGLRVAAGQEIIATVTLIVQRVGEGIQQIQRGDEFADMVLATERAIMVSAPTLEEYQQQYNQLLGTWDVSTTALATNNNEILRQAASINMLSDEEYQFLRQRELVRGSYAELFTVTENAITAQNELAGAISQTQYSPEAIENYFSLVESLSGIEAQRAEINTQINELITRGYSENGRAVQSLVGDLAALDAQAQQATNNMVWGFMQAAAAADGIITEDELEIMQQYATDTMGFSDAAAAAALNTLWLSQLIDGLPEEKRVELIFGAQGILGAGGSTAAAQAYIDYGVSGIGVPAQVGGATGPTERAGGGFVGPGESAIVGDSRTGARTGYEEMIVNRGGMVQVIPMNDVGHYATGTTGGASAPIPAAPMPSTVELAETTLDRLASKLAVAIAGRT